MGEGVRDTGWRMKRWEVLSHLIAGPSRWKVAAAVAAVVEGPVVAEDTAAAVEH